MQTKLTLRLEEELIQQTKEISRKTGKSLSQMVADYFSLLTAQSSVRSTLPPITRSLKGILAAKEVAEGDYRSFLEKKYQ
ncbi:MAG: antitoxin [Planctomycetes bacterium]|nr:antitoxin [Planctomycetota bacterium]